MGLPVVITTTGSTFSPKVALVSGSTATVTWDCPGASITTTGLNPTLSFGSAATRTVYMTAADANGYEAIDQVAVFNIGFDHTQDGSVYSPSSSYDYTAQAVSGVAGIHYMARLQLFLATGVTGLSGTLNFDGLGELTNIECFDCSVSEVVLAGCTSLKRICLEANNLATIDINPVAPNLFDFRAAAMQTGVLAFNPPIINPYGELFHFCIRDQVVSGVGDHPPLPDVAANMPDMQEYWIWNTRQSGTLTTDNPDLTSLRVHSNDYTTLTLSGSSPNLTTIDAHACSLSSVDLSAAPLSGTIDLSDNALAQAGVDAILAAVDSAGFSGGTLLLSGNTAPSGTGLTHKTSLTGKSWTVTTGAPSATVVQTATGTSGQPLNFGANVTAGNTVVLIAGAANNTGASITSSAPTLNGNSVAGSAAAFNPGSGNGILSAVNGSNRVYATAWVLPNCGAHNGLGLTISGGSQTGIIALEISGVSSAPTIYAHDSQSAAGGPPADSGLGYDTDPSVGAGVVIGLAQMYDGAAAGPPAPWTSLSSAGAGSATWAGYRSFSGGSGGAFHWEQTPSFGGTQPWCAGKFLVAP